MSSGTKSTIYILDVVACGIEFFVCMSLIIVVIFSSTLFKKLSKSILPNEQPGANEIATDINQPRIISPLLTPQTLPTPTPLPIYSGTIGYVPQDAGRWVVAEYWGYERNSPQQIQYQWVQVQR